MIWPIPMSEKIYIVTLRKKEDLEEFYIEMEENGFRLSKKRPISRNTHYWMNEEQAKDLKKDPRVLDVDELRDMPVRTQVSREPWINAKEFWKNGPIGSSINSNNGQWGHLHCAGDTAQRRKGNWGDGSYSPITEFVTDTVEIFDNGRHVDVVIVDDPVSYDNGEWESPSAPGNSRFIQYQWFNELNTLVNTIDDDGQTEPTGTITYGTSASTPEYHGNHVTGTVAGQHYGWAREANIYNIAVTDPWPSGQQVGPYLIFDYLRAFHQSKAVNPQTGKKNPTISNHSYGGVRYLNEGENNLNLADIAEVFYRGVSYTSSSPNPSGWTESGLEADFGIRFGIDAYPSYNSAIAADVQDAIDDGIVVIGAAGNDNLLMDLPSGSDWDNRIIMNNGYGTIYYNRGAWPNTPDIDVINVGSLSDHAEFRRSTFTNFGPGITVFAPGDDILSSYGNTGFADSKYPAGNYYRPISGTSMASPQVAGVAACFANTKERVSNSDIKLYLQKTSIVGDMTFDVGGSSSNATTFNITVTAPSFSYYTLNGTDRNGSVSGNDVGVVVYVGDTINFNLSNVSGVHPFRLRNSPGGSDVSTPAASGQGSSGNSTVSWTPNTVGDYVYQCSNHSSMYGIITVASPPSNAGTFTDNTCQKGSPNKYLIAASLRDQVGFIQEIKGERPTVGLGFPRLSAFRAPAPSATSSTQTYTFSVGYSGASHYVISGTDKNGSVSGNDPTITCTQGDIIEFNVSVSGHPFWIKTIALTGTSFGIQNWVEGVTTYGVDRNGQTSGTITLYTGTLSAGTYYYICQYHSPMQGQIVIEAA